MRLLSKSKLLSFRQCPRKLWLQCHHPELEKNSDTSEAGFAAGNAVGAVARRLFDPHGRGELVEVGRIGYEAAFQRTRELLDTAQPIFEGGFATDGAMAFADVMLPIEKNGSLAWRMVEVKSATSLKDYYREDAAIQAFVTRSIGVPLENILIAYVDNEWEYAGDGNYRGLFHEQDVTQETLELTAAVEQWIADAREIVAHGSEPLRTTGDHCEDPFPCGFFTYCRSREPPVEHPVAWLPNIRTKALKAYIAEQGFADLRDVPDQLLNSTQQRVKAATLSGRPFFDAPAAAAMLAQHFLPAFFLDFETIGFAVPIWKGTKPYQAHTFQFSVHKLGADGELEHRDFLDLSGNDPREALAQALIGACETCGPIFVYSGFEAARIRELAVHFPQLDSSLNALLPRLVDLRPIAERCYYHPSQQGSWSIKALLPALTGRSYAELGGVSDGTKAMEAYLEAIDPGTPAERKAEIDNELRAYCALDTEAMLEIWRVFRGRNG